MAAVTAPLPWPFWVLAVLGAFGVCAIVVRGLRSERVPFAETIVPLDGLSRNVALLPVLIFFAHIGASSLVASLLDVPFLPRGFTLGVHVLLANGASALVLLWAIAGMAIPARTVGLVAPRDVRSLLLVALACLAFLPPIGALSWLWTAFLEGLGLELRQQHPLRQAIVAFRTRDDLSATLITLGAVVAAPVWEELFYRGLLLGVLRSRLGDRGALVLSSALFALVHVEPQVLVPIFVVGVVLGAIVIRTGSIVHAILFHGIFNAVMLAQGVFLE